MPAAAVTPLIVSFKARLVHTLHEMVSVGKIALTFIPNKESCKPLMGQGLETPLPRAHYPLT